MDTTRSHALRGNEWPLLYHPRRDRWTEHLASENLAFSTVNVTPHRPIALSRNFPGSQVIHLPRRESIPAFGRERPSQTWRTIDQGKETRGILRAGVRR